MILLLLLTSFIQSTVSDDLHNKTTLSNYELISNITIEAENHHRKKITRWLIEIMSVPKGKITLKAIASSPHRLTIKHSHAARISAGRAIAPMTNDLTNGIGDNVTIMFDASMPDEGTHIVFSSHYKPIEFTAVQNLYHELSHAMHKMLGDWRYFASEEQAIEDENIFRKELAIMQGKAITERFGVNGHEMGLISKTASK